MKKNLLKSLMLALLTAMLPQLAGATVTVNVRTTTGDAPYLYVWNGAGTAINGAWPGTLMDASQTYTTTSDGLVWFTQTFEEDAINIIFDGGINGEEPFVLTSDIMGVTDTGFYIFDIEEGGYEDVTSTYITPTGFDINTLPAEVVFVEGKEFAYFIAPASWTNCNVWAWNNTTGTNFTTSRTWPGDPITLIGNTTDGNPVYQWIGADIVEGDRATGIIFNNGSTQTKDLEYVAGGVYNLAGKLLCTITADWGDDPVAQSFVVDGITYKVNADGSSVTVASGGSAVDAVIIPESVEYNGATYEVTAIAPQAFQNCSGLSAVIIPGTVTSIGDYAFRYSGLTFVAIPQSVTSMGSQVFYGCSHLQSMLLLAENCDNVTTGAPNVRNLFLAPSVASIKGLGLSPYHVYSYGSVPPVCDGTTFNSYSGTLHVPRQGLAPYFADEYWGNFNNFSGDAVWPATVNLTMSQEAVTMKIGETAQLTATADSIPTGMATMWFSTNPAVVEVSGNGSLVAKATGEATVIVLCGEHFATSQVTVEEETVTISLDKSELTLNMDDIATITPSHTPSIVPVEYTFTCSDNEVVLTQWKNGAIRLLATKPGTAVITVSSTDGNAVPATCEVTVRRPVGDVDGDGRVTTVDVTCLYNHLLDGDDTFAATSDVDGDGYITTADITAIYNILIGNAPLNNATEYTVGGVTFTMVAVDGGTFTMGGTAEQGSNASSNEFPTHEVTLSSFSIGQTEVTQELWQAVMGSNQSYFNGGSYGTNLKRPVERVSWNDCQAFITKLNEMTGKQFRLPTEAEWEYAARGGNSSQGYKYAGSNTIDDVAWYWDNIPSQQDGTVGYGTQAVGTKQANELGLYDMSGNVWEWCSDWYGDYSSSAQTNPTGPSSGFGRVVRGGSWYDDARDCRMSRRSLNSPGDRGIDIGLRLAL